MAELVIRERPPNVSTFDGSGDPREHIWTYQLAMLQEQPTEAVMCRTFLRTLSRKVLHWLWHLPPGSIGDFDSLARAFVQRFAQGIKKKHHSALNAIKQIQSIPLQEHMEKWNKELEEVEEIGDAMIIDLFHESLRPGPLYESLIVDPPIDYAECMERATSRADVEEALRRKRKEESESTPSKKQNRDQPSKNQRRDRERIQRWNQKDGRDQFRGFKERPGEKFTPLTLPLREVFQYLLDCNMV